MDQREDGHGIDLVAQWRGRANNDEWRMEVGDLINLVDDAMDEIMDLRLRLIAAQNPGIDIERVRAERGW